MSTEKQNRALPGDSNTELNYTNLELYKTPKKRHSSLEIENESSSASTHGSSPLSIEHKLLKISDIDYEPIKFTTRRFSHGITSNTLKDEENIFEVSNEIEDSIESYRVKVET